MKLSRDWLNDYVDLRDVSDEELERRFTEIGHAVESTEKHGDDTVFDLEITTNRVDAMSHLGMARELAAVLGREVRDPHPALRATLSRDAGEGKHEPPSPVSAGEHQPPSPASAGEGRGEGVRI